MCGCEWAKCASGSQPFVINGTTLPASQTTYSSTIHSFIDATGAPRLFPAALNDLPNGKDCAVFCYDTSIHSKLLTTMLGCPMAGVLDA
jgi:hypothetical protein